MYVSAYVCLCMYVYAYSETSHCEWEVFCISCIIKGPPRCVFCPGPKVSHGFTVYIYGDFAGYSSFLCHLQITSLNMPGKVTIIEIQNGMHGTGQSVHYRGVTIIEGLW